MVKVSFICHGNICRSTMAEFYMKHIVNKAGLANSIYIESAARLVRRLETIPIMELNKN